MAKSENAGKLVVHGVFSQWTYTKDDEEVLTLSGGENVVEDPEKDVLEAIGAAHDAGVLVIDEEQSDPKLVEGAHAGYESAEDAMALQDERVAAADPEAVVTHLAWEIERRLELANDALANAEGAGDRVFLTQAQVLLSHADSIMGRIEEVAGDDPAANELKDAAAVALAKAHDELAKAEEDAPAEEEPEAASEEAE